MKLALTLTRDDDTTLDIIIASEQENEDGTWSYTSVLNSAVLDVDSELSITEEEDCFISGCSDAVAAMIQLVRGA